MPLRCAEYIIKDNISNGLQEKTRVPLSALAGCDIDWLLRARKIIGLGPMNVMVDHKDPNGPLPDVSINDPTTSRIADLETQLELSKKGENLPREVLDPSKFEGGSRKFVDSIPGPNAAPEGSMTLTKEGVRELIAEALAAHKPPPPAGPSPELVAAQKERDAAVAEVQKLREQMAKLQEQQPTPPSSAEPIPQPESAPPPPAKKSR